MSEFNLEKAVRAAALRNKERQEEMTEELNVNASLLDPNSKEAKLSRAREQEKDVLLQIDALKWVRGVLKNTRLNQLLDRLSELLADQGKYSEAVKVAIDPERKAYYKSLVKATNIPDDTVCECEDEKLHDPVRKRDFTQSTELILAEVYDEKSDSMKNLTKCIKCGFLNIK